MSCVFYEKGDAKHLKRPIAVLNADKVHTFFDGSTVLMKKGTKIKVYFASIGVPAFLGGRVLRPKPDYPYLIDLDRSEVDILPDKGVYVK